MKFLVSSSQEGGGSGPLTASESGHPQAVCLRPGAAPQGRSGPPSYTVYRDIPTAPVSDYGLGQSAIRHASTGFVVGPTNYAPEHLLPQ